MATKTHNGFYVRCRAAVLCMVAATLLCGCDGLMHDDMEPCPQGIDLCFKYDYNVQRADMFNDHVGGLTVYVFDENGRFVMQQEENNTAAAAPLKDHSYTMHLSLQPGKYQFIALANQKSYQETLATNGAKFRRTELSVGDDMQTLQVKLDRNADNTIDATAPLDTLWHGMSTHLTQVVTNKATRDTLSLMRDTKDLVISLHNIADNERANISADDFEFRIIDRNGWLNYDNSLHEDAEITYTPFDTWTTEFKDEQGNVTERIAHAELTFSRLMYYANAADNAKNAMLYVINKKTGETVVQINLPYYLAQAREAFARYNYSEQEFLDREYQYKLDFFLQDGTWKEASLSISVLSWAKRIFNYEL